MRIRGILGLPAQTRKEIQIFKAIFENFANKNIRIFEWGSGFSSIYYSAYLQKRNSEFQWHSIDNNRIWHEKVRSELSKRGLQQHVQLYLKEFLPFWEKPGWGWENIPPPCGVFSPKSENEKAYINFPKASDKKFDIIIIDARFRRYCLQAAQEVLAPGGVVILHDAQKKHYHSGLNDFHYGQFFITGQWYPFQEIPNKVWVGSMGNESIFNTLKEFNREENYEKV